MADVDTVVIGSGMGGLTAALSLARAGQKVLVLEQHYAPGGWTHSFALEGHRFSPGVHYLGDIREGGHFRRTLEGLGIGGHLTFFELNRNGYEHVRAGDTQFDFCAGKENLRERLCARFPDDAKGIGEYIDLASRIVTEMAEMSNTRGFFDLFTLPYRTRHIGRYGLYNLKRILDDRIKNETAKGLLSVQCGDHGLPPSRVAFAMHASIFGHYLEGAHYPKGGGSALPNAFIKELRRHGGEIKLEARVEQILFEGGRAIGVKLKGGEEIRSHRVISNADPMVTYRRLVGDDRLPGKLKRKLAQTRWSTSAISLFFAVDADVKKLGLDSGNYWLCPDLDANKAYTAMERPEVIDQPQLPGMFLSVTTLKDPTSYVGRGHTCEAFTFIPYSVFERFASESGQRSKEYEALKAGIAAKMFATIEQHIPGLTKHVTFQSIGTPLTNQFYVEATHGAIYGTEKTMNQMGPWSFSSRSPFPGLSLVGASTLGHGLHGASLSGLGCAAGLLKVRPSELLDPNGPKVTTYAADDTSGWPEQMRARLRQPAALVA